MRNDCHVFDSGLRSSRLEDQQDRGSHIRVGAREILIEVAADAQEFLEAILNYEPEQKARA